MDELKEEEFQSAASIIKGIAPEGPRVLNGYTKSHGSYRPLLKPNNAKSVAISKETRSFSLDEPCYLTRIDVIGGDASLISTWLSLVAIGLDGAPVELTSRPTSFQNPDGTKVQGNSFLVNSVVTSVEAKSKRSYWSLKAQRIRVVGYTLSSLDAIASKVAAVEKIVAGVDAYVEKKIERADAAASNEAELRQSIVSLEEEQERLQTERDDLDEATAAAKSANDAQLLRQQGIERAISDASASLEAVKNSEVTLRETVNTLNRDIAKNKGELDKLLNDRSLISDEYKDYVKEGKQQSLVYQLFVVILFSVIAFCAWQLYAGAQRILLSEVAESKDLLALILQRAPFAVALSFIVGVAWKLGAMFVSRIMQIHAQRLALARLLVIAKDTVYSSTSGLDVSDQQKFRERIRLKLAMLRAHLTSELGQDFVYEDEDADKDTAETD